MYIYICICNSHKENSKVHSWLGVIACGLILKGGDNNHTLVMVFLQSSAGHRDEVNIRL